MEHLDELRNRLVRSIFFLVAGWIGGWILLPPIYSLINGIVLDSVRQSLPDSVQIGEGFRNVTEAFLVQLRISFYIGLVIAFPLIVLQIWGFIVPGLKPSERKPIARLAPLSLLLFAIGAGFCWFILPSAFQWFAQFLLSFPGTSLLQEPGTMVLFVMKMMLAFGIGFQLPLVVYALGALELLSAETLVKYWRQSVVAIFFLAGAITPSNDPGTMMMMAVPLVVLFMISVFFVRLTQRRKKEARQRDEESREPEAEESPDDEEWEYPDWTQSTSSEGKV